MAIYAESYVSELSSFERSLRQNIRNAWLAESVEDIRTVAVDRMAQGKRFEAVVLFELALEVALEG